MAPILRKLRAISVSRTARVFVDGGASIGISVMFGLSSLPDGYRFKRPVYRPFKDRYGRQNGLRAPAERLLPRHADICGRSFRTVLSGPHRRATPGREAQLFRACF